MKRLHHAHAHGNEPAEKPLVLSVCRHGVSDSWATKQLLEGHLETAKNFDILARGVDPAGIKETAEGTRGIELSIDEIKRAVLLLIHDSNVHFLRERFGTELVNALESEGYLLIRNGRECQHVTKNTGSPHRFIADCCKTFVESLKLSLRRRPASEMHGSEAFVRAERADERWHTEKDAKKNHKKKFKRH